MLRRLIFFISKAKMGFSLYCFDKPHSWMYLQRDCAKWKWQSRISISLNFFLKAFIAVFQNLTRWFLILSCCLMFLGFVRLDGEYKNVPFAYQWSHSDIFWKFSSVGNRRKRSQFSGSSSKELNSINDLTPGITRSYYSDWGFAVFSCYLTRRIVIFIYRKSGIWPETAILFN